MSVLYSQNNSPQQSYARCDWKREWRQANYFAFKEMFANFERHIDKHGECKFILASESGKFNWKRMSGHHLTSYPFRNGRGTAAYFIPEAFQSPLAKIGFGATLSVY